MARKQPTAEIRRLNKVLPRLELATALEIAGGDDELALAKLLRSTGESSLRRISTLAADIGIPFRRVVECYRDAKRLEGIVAVANRLPKVMEDVATDAESKLVTCAQCEGSGLIIIKPQKGEVGDPDFEAAVFKKCIPCEGQGTVIKSGDATARKQVLEIMELTGKAPIWAPGSNILVPGESLEDTLRGVRQRKEERNGADTNRPDSQRGPIVDAT